MEDAFALLEQANNQIVDKIETISAISEEVSAHATETYKACEDNTVLVDDVRKIVEKINNDAEKLQNND